jgi:ABC-type multidrug transport system fused ATPase/permease subunit
MQFDPRSIFTLAYNSIKILDRRDRQKAYKSIFLSIVNSILEILSLASILPVLTVLLKDKTFLNFDIGISKTYIITSLAALILLFSAKNIISIRILKYQLNFLGKVSNDLSEKLFRAFFRKNWIDYAKQNSADTWRKVSNISEEFTQYILHGYLNLITETLITVPVIVIMAYYNIQIFLICALFCVPVFVAHYFLKRKVLTKIENSFRELTPVTARLLYQGLDSFLEAKIYNKESYFIERYIDVRKATIKNLNVFKVVTALPNKIFETIGIFCFSGIIVYALLNDSIDNNLILQIGLLSAAVYRIIPALNKIFICTTQIQAYSYTIDELNILSNIQQSHEKVKPSGSMIFNESIEIESVTFSYESSAPLLKNFSFKISKGDFVLLQGPSGSGKTTLLYILSGLIDTYEGKIKIDGKELNNENIGAWHELLGVVTQQTTILDESLLKNIVFGEDEDSVNTAKLDQAIQLSALDNFIESLPNGLKTELGEHGHKISGGQAQRVALARALYRNPSILFLDEFTNQLDTSVKEKILGALKKQGMTILVSSHDAALMKYADKIIQLTNRNELSNAIEAEPQNIN